MGMRCGCCREYDEYGDRFCWCDSCWKGCQPTTTLSAGSLNEELRPSEPAARWELFTAGMLQAHDADPDAPLVSRKQLRARRLEPPAAVVQRWTYLHDVRM